MKTPASSDTVDVLLFSVLRERVGQERLVVPLEGRLSGAELLDRLGRSYPEIAAYRGVVRLAVNQEYVPEQVQLAAGDEVALITPVSGG